MRGTVVLVVAVTVVLVSAGTAASGGSPDGATGSKLMWSHAYQFPRTKVTGIGRAWLDASSRLRDACARDASMRDALGRLSLPGRFLPILQQVVENFPSAYRAVGYDDACSASRKFLRVGLDFVSSGDTSFCSVVPGGCPRVIRVYDEGRRLSRTGPDVCEWRIWFGFQNRFNPSMVLRTPCF